MKPPPYRTAGTLILFGIMVLLALWACPAGSRAAVAPAAITALSSLGLWASAKSAVQHATAKSDAAEPPK